MKSKDKAALHGATVAELDGKAVQLRKQIAETYMTMQTKEVKNRREAKELRKKLAVTLSVQRMKVLSEESR